MVMSASAPSAAAAKAAAITAGGIDEQLVGAIQRRLQGDTGGAPKKEYVAVAITLAQDPALVPGSVCKAAMPPITSSGTRQRIVGYRDRILAEGLLTACAEHTAVDPLSLEAERRAKRTKQRHDQREHWAELHSTIDAMIARVEARHEREQRALWRCPDGCCAGAADCGRVRFRLECAPRARAALEARRSEQWEQEHGFQREWHGASGHKIRNREQLWTLWEQQKADFEQQGLVKPTSFVQDDEWEEILPSFLSTWTGLGPPESWDQGGGRTVEYRGEVPKGGGGLYADRFGRDFRPAGPEACARRGCEGCCVCRGVQLTYRLEVSNTLPRLRGSWLADGPDEWVRDDGQGWMTVDELRRHVDRLQRLCSQGTRYLDAEPAYLLCRSGNNGLGDGRVLCVAGGVRAAVPEWELAVWDELLGRASILFQVAGPLTCGITLTPQEHTEQVAHLERQAALQAEAAAEWEPIRAERSKWDCQVAFEARRGCGLRLNEAYSTGIQPSFRVGNIIYSPPPDQSTQPGIAVVLDVERAHGMGGFGAVPTGRLTLMLWDVHQRTLRRRTESTDYGGDRHWQLLPPCCGQGAACPHLQWLEASSEAQFPNGDHLALSSIL